MTVALCRVTQPFVLSGVVWRCWVVRTGQQPGEAADEWRTEDGRCVVRRAGYLPPNPEVESDTHHAVYSVAVDGSEMLDRHATIKAAMEAAGEAARKRRTA